MNYELRITNYEWISQDISSFEWAKGRWGEWEILTWPEYVFTEFASVFQYLIYLLLQLTNCQAVW